MALSETEAAVVRLVVADCAELPVLEGEAPIAAGEAPTEEARVWGFITTHPAVVADLKTYARDVGRTVRDVTNDAFRVGWEGLLDVIVSTKAARDAERAQRVALASLPKDREKLAERQEALERQAREVEARLAAVRCALAAEVDPTAEPAEVALGAPEDEPLGADLSDLEPPEEPLNGQEPHKKGRRKRSQVIF